MQLIDGKLIAANLREKLSKEIKFLKEKHNDVPGLAVVQVGNVAASSVYVKSKTKNAKVSQNVANPHRGDSREHNSVKHIVAKQMVSRCTY